MGRWGTGWGYGGPFGPTESLIKLCPIQKGFEIHKYNLTYRNVNRLGKFLDKQDIIYE